MLGNEAALPHLTDQRLRSDAQVGGLGDEQPQLGTQVSVALVVRGGREQDDLAVVLGDVLLNGAVPLPLAVPEVVTLIDQHQLVSFLVRELLGHLTDRQHLGGQAVLIDVVVPHRHQVDRADDQRTRRVHLLHHPDQRGGHQRLAQADHVAEHDAAALVEMMRGNLHGGGLVGEQDLLQVAGNTELTDACPSLTRKVVGHLQVDLVRRVALLPSPALVDDLSQFQGDVDGPAVSPARREPVGELLRGNRVDHVDVQLSLSLESGEGEVAAPDVSDARRGMVLAVQQVQFGVQQGAQVQLDLNLPGFELTAQGSQPGLVTAGRRTEHQL